jgi:hypothetical protein
VFEAEEEEEPEIVLISGWINGRNHKNLVKSQRIVSSDQIKTAKNKITKISENTIL